MRLAYLAALITWMPLAAPAFEVEEQLRYSAPDERSVLRVISTADRAAFEPIIEAFQRSSPSVTVEYTITGTTDLMQAIGTDGAVFDLAISSAMDLQTKLANDGFARSYAGADLDGLPEWASWRDQVFAFTQEPAVLVISTADFPPGSAPQTRDDLIAILRADPERFRGRVGTYDIRRSGFGYLMATQDSRNSGAFWRLMEVMGRLETKLYCCSGAMIQDVAEGELALAYNVLGSYARAQAAQIDGFEIVEFDDFVNVMLRTALIPSTAQNEVDARRFIDFLIAFRNRPDLVDASGLPAISTNALQTNSALRPIRFGPGLLVFLDQLRRSNFLRNWESSVVQN
ncbi:ABC transporter substrate-binding protein [Actibacterium mucosum KCTC 23349]|uniref:ABC transporter substrate-binding protein n=1 Tax=Actibacterium mucosum KCTC 23349 TaxID=1454373 RepID=A0A037ZG92_9RHOB|nr:ABC transporter substrate-binding protein [Actibacterium mucosum]KAJ54638.1 ABC transporter substrate-binding protein [Actibacterium mucosum KCTC 23349]